MLIWTLKFDKKKATFWVIMAALVIVGVILLLGARPNGGPAKAADASQSASVKTEKARTAYIERCGWKVESPALAEDTVLIPKSFSKVFETYNQLQKQQCFDLSRYAGQEVKLYTYKVLDSGLGDNVLASLYVCNGTVIGGDVHSTELDGFMGALVSKQ